MLVSKCFTVPEYIKKCGTRSFRYWGVGSIDDVRLVLHSRYKHKKKERIVILSF